MMDAQKLKQEMTSLITAFIPTLEFNNNTDNARESLFASQSGSDNTIVKVITYSERELFDAPIDLLLEQKLIAERYSESFVKRKIVDIYHKLLIDQSKLDVYVNDLVNFFLTDTLKPFFTISEIDNIVIIENDKYELIDCTITILKKEDLPFKPDDQILFDADAKELINKPVIFTIVNASEAEKAEEIALNNFIISFNLLKLYSPCFKPFLKGCLMSGNQKLITYDINNGNLKIDHSKVGDLPLNTAHLDKRYYAELKKMGIDELKKVNSISEIVRKGLYWYGLGLEEKFPSAKLLNFVTVLETVLKKDETTELKKAVSERGSILLYDKFEQRKECCKKLKQIYDIRSNIVHTGTLIDEEDLTLSAGGYARQVLIKLIKLSKEFEGNFKIFINNLDDIKLGGVSKWQNSL